ncbi:MAG: outer membrane protein assembly factor BamE [Acidithiobacillus sp.]
MRSLRPLLLISLLGLLLTGCNIYRVNVQQGNVVTAKELAELHPGMDQLQVRTILGSPLLEDPWHPDQWVYVYSFKPAYGTLEVRKIYVLFDKDGKLLGVRGDVKAVDATAAAAS